MSAKLNLNGLIYLHENSLKLLRAFVYLELNYRLFGILELRLARK